MSIESIISIGLSIAAILISLATFLLEHVLSYFFKPELIVTVSNNYPDFVKVGSEYWFGIKIYNNGNRTAENVEICAAELYSDNEINPITSFIPMNLCWAIYDEEKMDQILPKTRKNCNIASFNKGDTELTIITWKQITDNINKIGPGKHKMKIIIGAKNMRSLTKFIMINFQGKYYEDQEEMFDPDKGVCMKIVDF